jgi:formylmethanofuran dehydrogenase subunit A
MDLIIKNGYVFDPKNGVDGDKADISIKDGKVVDEVKGSRAEVIDASGMLVMPGGVDLHSHIAGTKVNTARLLRSEDHARDFKVKTKATRSGVGYSVPSTFLTGYRYSAMGYTTVFEPASPPLKTLHTHEELNDIPLLDKACYPTLGNNWLVMEYLRDGLLEECAAYVAWLFRRIKGYAIKIVNPGGVEKWKWGANVRGLDDEVPGFNITPREIIRGLCKVNRILGLPHSIHVHSNRLGVPGNYSETLRTMDCVRDLAEGDEPAIHMTHIQFVGYGGVDWASVSSRADAIAGYVNKHRHVTVDMGQVIFTDTTTMTGDGPFQFQLHQLTGNRWINAGVEMEGGGGIVPMYYRRSNYAHAVMWTIGLELALLVDDPWRVFMTTDNPNGGPFTFYPNVISWLMSKRPRERIMKRVPRLSRVRSNIGSIDREYTFYEVAIVTRAATAKILGLEEKGHLGVGADADVAVYDINPRETDPARDYRKVRKALSRVAYTVKDGKIVVKNGEAVDSFPGRTYWVRPEVSEDIYDSVKPDLTGKFRNYYSIAMENYGVPEEYLPRSAPIDVPQGG